VVLLNLKSSILKEVSACLWGSKSSLVPPCKISLGDPGDVDNDSQSDCRSDLDSCAPEVIVPDARVFSSIKNEQKYPWLYDSVVHQGYLCNFVNCLVVILPHHKNLLLLALILIQYDCYSNTGHPNQ
jgi:hypothetical protein